MAASTRARNAVAGLTIVGMLLAAAATWWVGERRIEYLKAPITLSLAADDQLWVGQAGALHRFDASGKRLERLTLRELGLPEPLSHLHAVRSDDLVASAGVPTRVFRCTPSRRACRPADAGYIESFGGFRLAVWVGASADGSRVVVVDNLAHRLAVLDADGRLLAHAFAYPDALWNPAQPVWVGADTVWLAGADMKQINRYRVDGSRLIPRADAVATPTSHPLLRGRDWPMALAPVGDGRWWAVVQYDMMKPGGLFRFSENGGFDRQAQLPAGADLTAVSRLGDRLVVADFSRPALWSLDLEGAEAQPFGGEDFHAELAQFGTMQARLDNARRGLIAALVAIPVLGLLALFFMGNKVSDAPRVQRPDFRSPVPRVAGADAVEIRTTPDFRRHLRVRASIQLTTVVLLMPLCAYLAWRSARLTGFSAAVVAAVAVGVWVPLRWVAFRRTLAQRLVLLHGAVRLEPGWQEDPAVALDQCWCDGRTLAIGRRAVALFAGRVPVFDLLKLQAHVLGVLPAERWTSSGELHRQLLHATSRGPAAVGLAIALLVWAAAMVWIFFR
jgi:hypothetical protein